MCIVYICNMKPFLAFACFLSLLVMCCRKLNTSTINICNMYKYACNVMECSWKPNKKYHQIE